MFSILKRFKKPPTDERSKTIVAMIHCLLNQNSRDFGAARFPAANTEVIDILIKNNVGMFQLPCPEMVCLGLKRRRPNGVRIREVLDTEECRRCCRQLSVGVVDQVAEFLKFGYRIPVVLGGDVESPGCAVHPQHRPGEPQKLNERSGVFLKALWEELKRREIRIPFIGLRESVPKTYRADIACLKTIISSGN
jgi:predicted secreted protein